MLIILGLMCFTPSFCHGQDSTYIAPDKIYLSADRMPEPAQGYVAFYKYLRENIYYPYDAVQNKVEGYVFISFVVRKDGSLTDFAIVKSLGYGCDEEVERVFRQSPPWKPGMIQNTGVHVQMSFPVIFKLP